MLYEKHYQRILKPGYHVKYVPFHQQGLVMKYVPVYCSSSKQEVDEDEATKVGIAIVEVPCTESLGGQTGRFKREGSIKNLTDILFDDTDFDRLELEHALEAMALEPDLKLLVGKEVIRSIMPDNYPLSVEFAVRLLAESNLKGAIEPMTELLLYNPSYNHTSDYWVVHDLAVNTMRKFLIVNPGFRYEAACTALRLLSASHIPFYQGIMQSWAIELLGGLVYPNCSHCEWALEKLKAFIDAVKCANPS